MMPPMVEILLKALVMLAKMQGHDTSPGNFRRYVAAVVKAGPNAKEWVWSASDEELKALFDSVVIATVPTHSGLN